jgi:hypothetical protein
MLISVSEILKMLMSAIILKLIMIQIAMDMMLQINPLQTEYVAVCQTVLLVMRCFSNNTPFWKAYVSKLEGKAESPSLTSIARITLLLQLAKAQYLIKFDILPSLFIFL